MTTTSRLAGRSLVAERLYERLVARIVDHERLDRDYAERIMDQALAFLATAGRHAGEPLSPSASVDIGWHTFILHTREYAAFCDRVAGRFIHHVPDGESTSCSCSSVSERTLATIESAGYVIDPELWTADASRCGSCHEEGNCTASGKDGNENTDTRKKLRTV